MDQTQVQTITQESQENTQKTAENQPKPYIVIVEEPDQAEFFARILKQYKGEIQVKTLEILAEREFGFNPYVLATEKQVEKYKARPNKYEVLPVRSDGTINQEDIEQNTEEKQ